MILQILVIPDFISPGSSIVRSNINAVIIWLNSCKVSGIPVSLHCDSFSAG